MPSKKVNPIVAFETFEGRSCMLRWSAIWGITTDEKKEFGEILLGGGTQAIKVKRLTAITLQQIFEAHA